MPRPTSALVSPIALASTLVLAVSACSDAPTAPVAARVATAPAASVLSIGDLRRAHPQTPCNTAAYRQFDFWLGEWNVTTDGTFDGANNVTSELDGCLVAEHWGDAGEVKGWSLNSYDKTTGLWYQHWVDEFGVNLILSGGLENGTMVLEGTRPRLVGGFFFDRVSYTPLPGNHLRQVWDQGLNNGPTSVIFDGLYESQPGIIPPPAPGTTSCAGPNYRGADFMLGEWRVEAQNGLDLGHSSITAELSGCLVLEQFTTPKGYRAKSFLSYARGAAMWQRTYLDTEANRLFTTGTVVNGSLVMTGSVELPNGDRALTRVTWTKTAAGQLEQTYEISRNDGASWSVDQALIYVPV